VNHLPENGAIAGSIEDGALLTTGEMARRSNNTLRTVRFYEEEGILRPVRRTDGGHRLFDRSELERLMLVTDMRAAGLSLDEIKQILEVKQRSACGDDAARQATTILARRIEELRNKLAVLARLQDDLGRTTDVMTACIDCHDAPFPSRCDSCTVMASPSLPRSMRVLWSAHGGRAASHDGGDPHNPGPAGPLDTHAPDPHTPGPAGTAT
jgi:MerR family Zn(II)-responsive transcriptional regulator of zntA